MMTLKFMEDEGADGAAFYLKLPGKNESLLDAIKTLVPHSDRDQRKGLGWIPELRAWRFPMQYQNDILLLAENLAPDWGVEEVDYIER